MAEKLHDYQAVERYLMGALPMYQRDGAAAYKNSLDTSLALDAFDGYPHLMYRSIHVAGTNGKGSVSHMLCAVLMAMGYRVGLFTSPHLVDYRERIRVNGEMIDPDYIVDYVHSHRALFDRLAPSFFEMSAALALNYFADRQVDIAVVEVGMGGRLDSTNVIHPDLSIITNISWDHMAFLGDTLEEIAVEKAGIIKLGRPVVVGECDEECGRMIAAQAEKLWAPLRFAHQIYRAIDLQLGPHHQTISYETAPGQTIEVTTDLLGEVQVDNVATVLCALEVLYARGFNRDEEAVQRGLANVQGSTGLRGRWQVLQRAPLVVCDTGHNAAAIARVVAQIRKTPHANLLAVVGFSNDKEVADLLRLLPREAIYYWTQASVPRAMGVHALEESAALQGLFGYAYPTVAQAFAAAMANASPDDMVFVGGSTFVVADGLRAWREREGTQG